MSRSYFHKSPAKELSKSIAIFNSSPCQESLLSILNNACVGLSCVFSSLTMNRSCSLCERPFQSVESWTLHPALLMHLSSAACPSYHMKVQPHFHHLSPSPMAVHVEALFLCPWDLECISDAGWRGFLVRSAQSGCGIFYIFSTPACVEIALLSQQCLSACSPHATRSQGEIWKWPDTKF